MKTEYYSIPFINGWLVHKRNGGFGNNPHRDYEEPYSRIQWEAGYCARRSAFEHGGDLSLDDLDFGAP